MKITEIELVNFRQHAKQKLAVVGNLVGVVGPNGSGKSNLLNAIQFGLVGEVPGVNKEKLVRWGETSGYVRLVLDTGAIIKRDLVSAGAELYNPNGTKIHGTTSVNNALKALYGLDKELAKQAIFVRQAELDSVLFETPAKREQSFQKLCGMGQASTLHRQVGDVINAKFHEPPNYDEQLTIARQKIQENESRIVELTASMPDIPPNTEIVANKLKVANGNSIVIKLNKYESIFRDIEECESAITASEEEAAKLIEANNDVDINLDALDSQITGARQLLSESINYNNLNSKVKQANAQINKLTAPTVPEKKLADMEQAYIEACSKYSESRGRLSTLKSLLDSIASSSFSACPLCGNTSYDTDGVKKKLHDQIADCLKVGNPDTNNSIKKIKQEWELYNKSVISARATLDAATKDFAQFKDPVTVEPDVIENEIRLLEQTKRNIRNARDIKLRIDVRIKEINNNLGKKELELSAIATDIIDSAKELWPTMELNMLKAHIEQTVIQLTELLDDINAKANIRSKQAGIIQELTTATASLKENVIELEKKRECAGNYSNVMKVITGVRDWFHYTNGPRTLSANIINDMTSDINMFLDKLESPFYVTPNTADGLSFQCIFNDGRASNIAEPPNAEDLSGGQKIILATAFRLAGYCMFANQLGLLSLDEPTNYLDDKNIMRFCSFLNKVKEVASALNLQIFMATHERSVMPYMDTIIDLQ